MSTQVTSAFARKELALAGLPTGTAGLRAAHPAVADAAWDLASAEKRLAAALTQVASQAQAAATHLAAGSLINTLGVLQGAGPAADARAAEVATWQLVLQRAIAAAAPPAAPEVPTQTAPAGHSA